MLVLANADGLGVDFHEFRERIHQAAADGNGAAHGDVLVGEFLARSLGGGVDRGAALVDHDDLDRGRELEFFHESLGLAGGGAVADRDGLDVVFLDEGAEFDGGLVGLALRAGGAVQDGVEEEAALGIEHDGFATGAETGVDGDGAFAAEGRSEHEFAEVFREDPDGGLIGAFFSE